ncbi:MAG: FHA domain-containing protein [Magnetococcus sp. MYC-9]
MAKVIVKFKDQVRRQVTLHKETTTIGRTPDNDIPIENLAVSRHHAEILQAGGGFRLRDLQSSNGTFLQGVRITEQPLRDGDAILIGKHTLLFIEDDSLAMAMAALPKSSQDSDTFLRSTMEWEIPPDEASTLLYAPTSRALAHPGSLVVQEGKLAQERYTLSGESTLIGGAGYADVRLTSPNAPAVAAVIRRQGDVYSISPSEPGVLLNNRKLIQPKNLENGYLITIQGVVLEFRAGGAQETKQP